jgi:hypothetical protein
MLFDMRQHAAWPELLERMKPTAPIPAYSPIDGEDVEKARSTWIFRSGQWRQYQMMRLLLTGQRESLQGDSEGQKQET